MHRQLKHDRDLLGAQNRATAARALGAVIVREARREEISPGRMGGWDGSERIYAALTEANIVLGGLDEELPASLEYVDEARDLFETVLAKCDERREAIRDREEIPDKDLEQAFRISYAPYLLHLDDIGRTLMRWDGVGKLPAEPPWFDADVLLPGKNAGL